MSSPVRLKEILREPSSEGRLHDNWVAIEQRRARRPSMSTARWAAAAVVLLAIGAGATWQWSASAPSELRLASGAPFDDLAGRVTELSDGSRIAVAPQSELELLESAPDRVALLLTRGHAEFEVTPGGPRRWIVEAGAASVEVLGTRFTVERDDTTVRVQVERGMVLVRSDALPHRVRRLRAGDSVVISPVVEAPVDEVVDAPVGDPPAEVPTEPSIDARANEAPEEATEEQLLDRADRARSEGRTAEAARVLEQLLRAHPNGDHASLAAVTLARLELRQLDRPERAARALERALALGIAAPLAEDVYAMRVEAWARTGDMERARRAAADYDARYAGGRWSTEVRRWVP